MLLPRLSCFCLYTGIKGTREAEAIRFICMGKGVLQDSKTLGECGLPDFDPVPINVSIRPEGVKPIPTKSGGCLRSEVAVCEGHVSSRGALLFAHSFPLSSSFLLPAGKWGASGSARAQGGAEDSEEPETIACFCTIL